MRTLGRDKDGQGGTRMLRKDVNYQKAQGQLEGMGIVSRNADGQGSTTPGKDKDTGWTTVLRLEKD